MDTMDVSEENVPPAKKLKQATLSFFKTSASKPASSPSPSQGVKRKLHGNCESPNKLFKVNKPLVDNNTDLSNSITQSGNLKKSCKLTDIDDNDQEVSSSSEADGAVAKNGGKCCLMEKFVRKLPKDVHQEISSTNEALDASVELPEEDADCIIIEENDKKEASITVDENDKEAASASSPVEENDKEEASASTTVEESDKKETSESTDSDKRDLQKKETKQLSEVKNTPKKKTELPTPSLSPIAISSPISISTPISKKTSSLDESPSSCGETPKTSGKKRGRKIDPVKKAEMEMIKQKKKEEKEKEREEKKQKLEEEKLKKEQARKELKEAKEKEKEKLEKERLEKQKAKEEEKKKKEEERLKKEEEKRKINEAKQEEKQKKEEEKRLKEEEKRQKEEEKRQKEEEKRIQEEEKLKEEEKKKMKAEKTKQAFQSFFIKPKNQEMKQPVVKSNASIFFPFQVKKDMHLAPAVRSSLTEDKKDNLDQLLKSDKIEVTTYLQQLKGKEVRPHRTGRILRKNLSAEEVEIVHDSEALKKAYHSVKVLQFHEDVRPPYYGTWRKITSLNPRNPWYKDEATFDYEMDSEAEWEEEEPGESLSCSEGEEEKGEDAIEEEEEDGWMVPHGYLSEDEGCNDDDEISPEKLKLQQQAKAKAWELEQRQKLQAAPVITVGCYFEHSPSRSMTGDVRLLYEYRAVVISTVVPIPTSQTITEVEDNSVDQEGAPIKSRGSIKKEVPDEAMPYLIQLMHGNTCGIKRLIKEFRVFWLKKNDQPTAKNSEDLLNDSGDISILNDSVCEPSSTVDEKESMEKAVDGGEEDEGKREEGQDCSISKRQLEKKITSIGVREKRPGFNKVCWYVNSDVLSQYKMEDQSLPNTWTFCTVGPTKSPNVNKSLNSSKLNNIDTIEVDKEVPETKPTDQKSIMSFTMSREELLKQESLKPKPVAADIKEVLVEKVETPSKLANDQRSILSFTKTNEEINLLPKSQNTNEEDISKTPTNLLKTLKDKKPKLSVMDMLLKKSLVCKKKLPDEQITKGDPNCILNSNTSESSVSSSNSYKLSTVEASIVKQCSVLLESIDGKCKEGRKNSPIETDKHTAAEKKEEVKVSKPDDVEVICID